MLVIFGFCRVIYELLARIYLSFTWFAKGSNLLTDFIGLLLGPLEANSLG